MTAIEREQGDEPVAGGGGAGDATLPAPAMFLGMLGSSAVGWAAAAGGKPATLEFYVNGQQVDRGPANRSPFAEKDFAQIWPAPTGPVSPNADWFLLKSPAELRDGQVLAVEVRLGDTVLGGDSVRLFGGLKAKFVGIKDSVAQGFVANPLSEAEPPDIELVIDGAPVQTFTLEPPAADGRRRFNIPLELRDGENHMVALRFAGSATELVGSPHRWRSPVSEAQKARDLELYGPKSHPAYILPHTELSAVADMLARQGLAARFPGAVADHAARLWPTLAQPSLRPGPRLNVIVSGSAFADADTAFALSQILERDDSAACYGLLPSEEARRFAADDHRGDAGLQLFRPLLAAEFSRFAARLPGDDLIVLVPPHAVVDEAFLARLDAVRDGREAGFAAGCAQAALAADGGVLVAASSALGWRPASAAAAVFRAGDVEAFTRVRAFDFEGVRFHELELNVGVSEPAAVAWQVPAFAPSTAAATLVVVAGAAGSSPQGDWARLAPRVRMAAAQGGPGDLVGYEGGFEPEGLRLLAELIGGSGSVLLLDADRAAPAAALGHCRAVASDRALHTLRHLEGPTAASSVADLASIAQAALSQTPFGYYLPAEPPAARD